MLTQEEKKVPGKRFWKMWAFSSQTQDLKWLSNHLRPGSEMNGILPLFEKQHAGVLCLATITRSRKFKSMYDSSLKEISSAKSLQNCISLACLYKCIKITELKTFFGGEGERNNILTVNVRREALLILWFKVTGESKNTEYVISEEPIFLWHYKETYEFSFYRHWKLLSINRQEWFTQWLILANFTKIWGYYLCCTPSNYFYYITMSVLKHSPKIPDLD